MGWERKRGKLHELNLLLRGDSDTSFLPPERAFAGRRRLCDDAGCRHALTRDCGDRLVGKLAHPAQPSRDSTRPTRRVIAGYSILQPRVTAVSDHRRRRILLPAHLLGQSRPRPLCLHRLRCLSGPRRRRHVHRQGPLPCRCLRDGAGGQDRGERGSQPRPAGRLAIADARWSPMSNSSRISRSAIGRGVAPASLGAGRLAVAAVYLRPESASAAVALEDDRQSAPLADPDRLGAGAIAGWTLLPSARPRYGRRC